MKHGKQESKATKKSLILKTPTGRNKSFRLAILTIFESGKRKEEKYDCEALESVNKSLKAGTIIYNEALDMAEAVRFREKRKLKDLLGVGEESLNLSNKRLVERYIKEEYSKRKHLKVRTKKQIHHEFYAVLRMLGAEISLIKDDRDTIYYKIAGDTRYSEESKRRLMCRFNALLKFCGRDFVLPKITVQRNGKVKHINETELKDLIFELADDADKIAARLFFYTGLRTGELFGLKEGDIDFKDRTISVNKQMTREGRIERPKNNKERDVPFSDKITDDIKKWLEYDESFKKDKVRGVSKRFLSASRKTWGKSQDKDITPHDLRRSYAIYLINKGFSITEVALLLGDSEKVVQMYYSGYSAGKDMLNSLRDKLG